MKARLRKIDLKRLEVGGNGCMLQFIDEARLNKIIMKVKVKREKTRNRLNMTQVCYEFKADR
jgi:hypothetical protein